MISVDADLRWRNSVHLLSENNIMHGSNYDNCVPCISEIPSRFLINPFVLVIWIDIRCHSTVFYQLIFFVFIYLFFSLFFFFFFLIYKRKNGKKFLLFYNNNHIKTNKQLKHIFSIDFISFIFPLIFVFLTKWKKFHNLQI